MPRACHLSVLTAAALVSGPFSITVSAQVQGIGGFKGWNAVNQPVAPAPGAGSTLAVVSAAPAIPAAVATKPVAAASGVPAVVSTKAIAAPAGASTGPVADATDLSRGDLLKAHYKSEADCLADNVGFVEIFFADCTVPGIPTFTCGQQQPSAKMCDPKDKTFNTTARSSPPYAQIGSGSAPLFWVAASGTDASSPTGNACATTPLREGNTVWHLIPGDGYCWTATNIADTRPISMSADGTLRVFAQADTTCSTVPVMHLPFGECQRLFYPSSSSRVAWVKAFGAVQPTVTATIPTVVQQTRLPLPPPVPKRYPENDQTVRITGDLLKDPLVADAWAHVQRVVPASLLNINPSFQIEYGQVTYRDDSVKNCYWPASQCVRRKDTEYYRADVVTCPTPNTWGVTFDDGPTKSTGPDTAKIQTELASINANATFFCTGTASRQNLNTLRATFAAGYHIASHTYTHKPMTNLTNEQIVAELKYTESVLYETLGIVPRFFRPPYGDIDDRVRAIAHALGYTAIIWTQGFDSQDTTSTPTDSIVTTVVGFAKPGPGFISLQHDISTKTSDIAVRALQKIRESGLHRAVRITSVADCIGEPAYVDPATFTPRVVGPCPTYTTRDGDTCGRIATDHGLDLTTFTSLNPTLNCNALTGGQVVCVGQGQKPAISSAISNVAAYAKELVLIAAAAVGMQFL
ncbi:chitin deacetylase [Geranomyces michiganensis]|nr:chitin deacetylase [Geranomyces michiganensis]